MNGEPRPTLITGGAGFIGTNVAHRLLSSGAPVLLLDNLSRPGVEGNLRWLRQVHRERVQVEIADVRDGAAMRAAVARAGRVFHFAGQTAVTTSLRDPLHDFEINARGTLNLLEALRALDTPPPLVFTSTNKVYGALSDVALRGDGTRYEPVDALVRANGVGETRAVDFHSPYGCSKGTADQYVIDYARTFGLPAVVFRMSCIYGRHQLGSEDQGWIAHFLLRALAGDAITIYGDGRQVRDALCVDDLVDALILAQEQITSLRGQVFNLGGGPENTISLLELVELVRDLHGPCRVEFSAWRAADQRYYVSDTRRFRTCAGWKANIPVRAGVAALYQWFAARRGMDRRGPSVRAVNA